jgi:hypothetical protein
VVLIAAVCLILTLALGYWVFTARPEASATGPRQIRQQALEERKQAVYENLKDLHFEHLAGKLSDADFQRTRAMLEQEAAGVIAALEQLS